MLSNMDKDAFINLVGNNDDFINELSDLIEIYSIRKKEIDESPKPFEDKKQFKNIVTQIKKLEFALQSLSNTGKANIFNMASPRMQKQLSGLIDSRASTNTLNILKDNIEYELECFNKTRKSQIYWLAANIAYAFRNILNQEPTTTRGGDFDNVLNLALSIADDSNKEWSNLDKYLSHGVNAIQNIHSK